MARMLLLVAMLVASLVAHAQVGETDQKTMSKAKAERQARRDAYAAEIDGIVRSRNYIFRPITMQNVVTGNTRSVFAYYLYAALEGDKVVLHLPVEFTSYLIDTVNLDSYTEGYVADLEGGNWRITFSLMNGAERWFVEIFASNITGQTRLALVTPQGVMRYLGTLESSVVVRKKERRVER